MSLPNIPAHLQALVGVAVEQDDQSTTAVYSGGEPPKAGVGFAVLTQYIELGLQPPKPGAQYPKNKDKVRLVFNLLGPLWPEKEIEVLGPDGQTKIKKTVNEAIAVELTLSNSDKADFHNLLLTMQRAHPVGATFKHMTQFLGVPFVTEVVHNTSGEGTSKKTYANLNVGKTWNFRSMSVSDPMSGQVTTYQAPAVAKDTEYKVFLFQRPTKETWDSLFMPGMKEDGKGTRNWIQEKITAAVNYPGSQLQALLGGFVPTATDAASALATAQAQLAASAVPATTTVEPAPAQESTPVQPPVDTAPVAVTSPTPAPLPEPVAVVEQKPQYKLTAKAPQGATIEAFLADPRWTIELMVQHGYAELVQVAAVPTPDVPAIPAGLPLPVGLPVGGV